MKSRLIVMDRSVLDCALRSNKGASFKLLSLVGRSTAFEVCLSVPVVLEYEAIAKRHKSATGLSDDAIDAIIDYICSVARLQPIYYLWRPLIRDPGDDMVLELAVASGCDAIVTFNKRDLIGAEKFGIRLLTPREFLAEIGELK